MMFESDMENDSLSYNFDAVDAFMTLMNQQTIEAAPIFSKLVIWMSWQDDATITDLYQQARAALSGGIHNPKFLYVMQNLFR